MPRPVRLRGSYAERLARVVVGLTLFGLGVTLLIQANLGAAPWDVFHQGISRLTGVQVGTVIIGVGLLLLLLWIPLRQRPGVGTLLNALQIGAVVNLTTPLVPAPEQIWLRVGFIPVALLLFAIGTGLYIGAGLGSGPRDGLMMGLSERGLSIRTARTLVEVTVVGAGLALGGTVGVGTVAFAIGIGPLVQVFLPRLRLSSAKSQ